MSDLRSILVHVDASPRCAVRLNLARELAARHEAVLTALYAVQPSHLALPMALADGSAGVIPALMEIDAERRAAARALFDRDAAGKAATRWADLNNDPVIAGFSEQALYADLLLLGQHDASDPMAAGVPADFIESVLIASGKPALIVPYVGSFSTLGRDVLVAWKPTREAAHAVSASLPLLQRAQSVHIVADATATGESEANPLQIGAFLKAHGIEAKVRFHNAASTGVGDSVLSLAADVQADLIVMGCYGHSRARELVLGGLARTLLTSMAVP